MSMVQRSTKGRRGGRAAEPYVRVLARSLGDVLRRRRHHCLRVRGGKWPCRWREREPLLPLAGSARVFATARAAGLKIRSDRRGQRTRSRDGGKTPRQAMAVRRRRGRKCGEDEDGGDDASRPSCSRHVPNLAHVRKRTLSEPSGAAVFRQDLPIQTDENGGEGPGIAASVRPGESWRRTALMLTSFARSSTSTAARAPRNRSR